MSLKMIALSLTILTVTGVCVGVPLIRLAQTSAAASDLAQVRDLQTLATANDGSFASSMTALTDDSLGRSINPKKGASLSYIVSPDHWVAAEKLPSGKVFLISDTTGGVTCDAFTADCISQITPDAILATALPVWTTF